MLRYGGTSCPFLHSLLSSLSASSSCDQQDSLVHEVLRIFTLSSWIKPHLRHNLPLQPRPRSLESPTHAADFWPLLLQFVTIAGCFRLISVTFLAGYAPAELACPSTLSPAISCCAGSCSKGSSTLVASCSRLMRCAWWSRAYLCWHGSSGSLWFRWWCFLCAGSLSYTPTAGCGS